MTKTRNEVEGTSNNPEKKRHFRESFDKFYEDPPILEILAEHFDADILLVSNPTKTNFLDYQ